MQVVTRPVTHYRDEFAGFLNIPSKLDISPASPTSEAMSGGAHLPPVADEDDARSLGLPRS